MRYLRFISLFTLVMFASITVALVDATPTYASSKNISGGKASCSGSFPVLGNDQAGYYCNETTTSTPKFAEAKLTCSSGYSELSLGVAPGSTNTQAKSCADAATQQQSNDEACGDGWTYDGGAGKCINLTERRSSTEANIAPIFGDAQLKDKIHSSWTCPEGVSDCSSEGEAYKNAYLDALYQCSVTATNQMSRAIDSGTTTRTLGDFFSTCLRGKFPGISQDALDSAKSSLDGSDSDLASIVQGITDQTTKDIPGQDEEEATCGNTLKGIGWIACTVIENSVEFADGVWSLFEGLLVADPLKNQDGAGSALYETWSNMRDIANVIMVVLFIAIIMSQVSNIGISNYGIKKMLPRLIIAAIAINISYFMMQITVDAANILGKTLHEFITGEAAMSGIGERGWQSIVADILLNTAVVGVGAAGIAAIAGSSMAAPIGLLLVLIIVVPAIIGLVAGLLALSFRSALIPVLAALSPIAIAAWVLPNTQKIFNKWKDAFFGMVFLYPLASVYYGALKFMSLIVLNNPSSGSLDRLFAVGTLSIGAFVVLFLAVKSNSITGKIMGVTKGFMGKLTAPLTNFASGAIGAKMALGRARAASMDYSGRRRINPATWGGRILRSARQSKVRTATDAAIYERAADLQDKQWLSENRNKLSSVRGGVAGADAHMTELAHSATATEIKNAELAISGQSLSQLEETLKRAFEDGDSIKARAAQNRMFSMGSRGVDTFTNTVDTMEQGSETHQTSGVSQALRQNTQANHGGVMDSDPALLNWSSGVNSNMEGARGAAYVGSATIDKFTKRSEQSQLRTIASGGISEENARAMLDTRSESFEKLSDAVKKELRTKFPPPQPTGGARTSSPSPNSNASQPTTTTQGGQTFQQSSSGLFVPKK